VFSVHQGEITECSRDRSAHEFRVSATSTRVASMPVELFSVEQKARAVESSRSHGKCQRLMGSLPRD